jgi:patatin-like phospholipase/acyl hydrolase
VLAELERLTGSDFSTRFDVFVGTSVGGIVALGLAAGLSARQLSATIIENVQRVFSEPVPLNPYGLRATRYQPNYLRDCIRKILGPKSDTSIRSLEQNIVVPAVDANSNQVIYFSNVERIGSTSCLDASLIDVALATSSAPTYFPPHRIGKTVYLDGGIASNNPDIEAIRFTSSVLSRPTESTFILSVGTGDVVYRRPDQAANTAGAIKWMTKYKLLDRIMSLQESKASGFVADLLQDHYLRIDTTFDAEIALDACQRSTVDYLQSRAVNTVATLWKSDASKLASFIR